MPWALALLLSVTLSAPFGEASARLIGFTPQDVTFEVTVEVTEPAAIVLLRGEDVAGTEVEPVALIQREDGTWGAVVELPARRDITLVFELVPPVGGSILSDPASLVDLGIRADVLSLGDPAPVVVDETSSIEGLPWIILAVVAGLAALVLLLVGLRSSAVGGAARRSGEDTEDTEDTEELEVTAGSES